MSIPVYDDLLNKIEFWRTHPLCTEGRLLSETEIDAVHEMNLMHVLLQKIARWGENDNVIEWIESACWPLVEATAIQLGMSQLELRDLEEFVRRAKASSIFTELEKKQLEKDIEKFALGQENTALLCDLLDNAYPPDDTAIDPAIIRGELGPFYMMMMLDGFESYLDSVLLVDEDLIAELNLEKLLGKESLQQILADCRESLLKSVEAIDEFSLEENERLVPFHQYLADLCMDWKSKSKALEQIGDASLLLSSQIATEATRLIPVLIYGETGTGKERTARAIHELSSVAKGPFLIANVGGLDDNSELFGHVRGAFTGAVSSTEGLFQQANGGTLFLDEIGDMSRAVQVKLLRALANGEVRKVGDSRSQKVDVRIIAATHTDLEEAVKEGEFRKDLYYRLRAHQPLTLFSLGERSDEDLNAIWTKLCQSQGRQFNGNIGFIEPPRLSSADIAALRRREWNGNIRELEWEASSYSQAVGYDAKLAGYYTLSSHLDDGEVESEDQFEPSGRPIIDDLLDGLQRILLDDMLEQSGKDIAIAAERIGLRPAALRKRVERLKKRLPTKNECHD